MTWRCIPISPVNAFADWVVSRGRVGIDVGVEPLPLLHGGGDVLAYLYHSRFAKLMAEFDRLFFQMGNAAIEHLVSSEPTP